MKKLINVFILLFILIIILSTIVYELFDILLSIGILSLNIDIRNILRIVAYLSFLMLIILLVINKRTNR